MNVLVIGAGGKVGREIISVLARAVDKTPIAQVRHQHQADEFEREGVNTRLVDLEDDISALKAAMQGVDAVIFSAGSGGSTGNDKTLLIDLDGAIKTIQAAQQAGIKRYIMVSALGADQRERWNARLKPYYVAKHYADEWLTHSGLDYTILRPGTLSDDAPSQHIQPGFPEQREGLKVARSDVALVAVAALDEPASIGKALDFVAGDQAIGSVLSAL